MRFVFYSSLSKRYQRLADKIDTRPIIIPLNGTPHIVIKGGQPISEVAR